MTFVQQICMQSKEKYLCTNGIWYLIHTPYAAFIHIKLKDTATCRSIKTNKETSPSL